MRIRAKEPIERRPSADPNMKHWLPWFILNFTHREIELELREELDLQQAKMREVAREKETALEVICDHENTIAKFRTFVNQVPHW
jgi:hypothetical protein